MRLIPKDQLCQAFDPMLILKEKTIGLCEILDDGTAKSNTSCITPAYVYMEGSHGKRFLCDYHYYYEYNINKMRTPELWTQICQVLIDEREYVKETFAKPNGTIKDLGPCWCEGESYVELQNSETDFQYFCNFHFRKLYYRYLLHGKDLFLDESKKIHDQRHLITKSIDEDTRSVRAV